MKDRIEYIDLAKGICILLVVLDHISGSGYFAGGDYPMNEIFEQTRMPLYFILSGLFFKDYAGGIREFLLRKFNRILVPYLFFMCLYIVAVKAVYLLTGFSLGEVWAPLWFLLCLFWMNFIFATAYYAVRKAFAGELLSETVLGAIMLVIGIGGYYAGDLPLSIGSAMTSMPFLWMGYLLNRKMKFFGLEIGTAWSLLTSIVLLVALHYMYVGENFFYLNSYSAPLAMIYLSGVMGTLAVLLLSRVVKRLPVISYIGRYSIIVLCTHMAIVRIIMAVASTLPAYGEDTIWSSNVVQSFCILALTLACCIACCWLLSRYLPWFTAQKDLVRWRFS